MSLDQQPIPVRRQPVRGRTSAAGTLAVYIAELETCLRAAQSEFGEINRRCRQLEIDNAALRIQLEQHRIAVAHLKRRALKPLTMRRKTVKPAAAS